jgi:very-short-patch-repair endonuclease
MGNRDLTGLMAQARTQHGVITQAQAEQLEITRRALFWLVKNETLQRVAKGIYRYVSVKPSFEQNARIACYAGGHKAAVSHVSAGYLHGLDGLKDREPKIIDLSLPRARNVPKLANVATHRRVVEMPLTIIRKLPVTTLPQTIVDLAGVLGPRELELALDSAQRKSDDLLEGLAKLIGAMRHPLPAGVPRLVELMIIRGTKPTDSGLEVDLGRRLRAEKFTGFVAQHEIWDGDEYVMRVDFAWVALKIAVHADSYSFHHQRERFERDARQRTKLAGMGWTMIMVTREMLDTQTNWVLSLKTMLEERGPQRQLGMQVKRVAPPHGPRRHRVRRTEITGCRAQELLDLGTAGDPEVPRPPPEPCAPEP